LQNIPFGLIIFLIVLIGAIAFGLSRWEKYYREKDLKNLANSVQSLLSEFETNSISIPSSPHVDSLLEILRDLQSQMSHNEEINFGQYSFGIFRTVTDDYDLEKSDFGQRMLKISNMIQKVK
jgi:hypothetical protein